MTLHADVQRNEPLAFSKSWPLFEKHRHFELGAVLNCAVTDATVPANVGELGFGHAGCWECDLTEGDRLFWSGGVYDLFGLPRGSTVARHEAVRFYAEHSRATMERLRAHAIDHQQGFTLDAEIRPAAGEVRWMRLIGVPVCREGRAVGLHGLKLVI